MDERKEREGAKGRMHRTVMLGALLAWSALASPLVAADPQDEFEVAPEPEPIGPHDCDPALLEADAIRMQDLGLSYDGLSLAPPPPPVGPPCEGFKNHSTCPPHRCFWYPNHKVCKTYAPPPLPCGCPAFQHCKPLHGKPPSKLTCLYPHNTCPERCVWNREQLKCSLYKLPPPAGEIDTSNKGVLELIGLGVLMLCGIGVIIGFLIRWVEKAEVRARMTALPVGLDGDLIAPLNEDGIDDGGEREYRRADGEYSKGRMAQ